MRYTVFTLAFIFLCACRAEALCIYKGKMYAKTTVAEEFSDSRWVVHAKLIAADQHWSDEDESWTLYHLQVLESFKGHPPAKIDVFTYRDSGGFYLDNGMNADLGGEYLLFLDPVGSREKVPAAARRTTEANYNCGQSKVWSQVSQGERDRITRLSNRN